MNKKIFAIFGILFLSFGLFFNKADNVANAFEDNGVQLVHQRLEFDTPLTVPVSLSARFECSGFDYYGMEYSQAYNGQQYYYSLTYFTNNTLTSRITAWSSLYSNNQLMGWLSNNYRFIELIDATTTNLNTLGVSFGFTRSNFRLVNGWFTFNYNIVDINQYINNLYLPFTSNGVYYTNLNINGDYILYDTTIVYKFDNFNWSNVSFRLLYLESTYITESDYNLLSSYGVWSYVDINPNYTLSDLIFTFVDIPIYTLTRLLNFEFIGVSLIVALGSLLLLFLIFKLFKKFL